MCFRLALEDNKTKVSSHISDFRVKLKLFKKKKFEKQNSYLILSPTSVSLTGNIERFVDEDSADVPVKQLFILDIQDINLNMCPPMLNTSMKMMNSIQKSIERKFKSNELITPDFDENFSKIKIESFFTPIFFTQSDFWFTPNSNLSRSSSLYSVSSMSDSQYSLARSATPDPQNKSSLNIRTSKIEIKLETGVSDQIPLILLSLSLNGELSNWTTKPSISLTLDLEMSYFNESLNVWEPVIEPVEDIRYDKLKPYQLLIDV
jgi:hypothetical protein